MAGPRGRKRSPGALALGGGRGQRPGWGLLPWGQPEPWPGARPGPLNSNHKRKPPGARQTPKLEPLWVRQAGGRECLPQGPVGAQQGTLSPNRQGSLPWPGELQEGNARPGAQWGPGAQLGLSEHCHTGESS
ncbi:hypothetical protein NDU88_002131 [Pleurodeles waltl]|uniref:Uncharacterized protein n=1 Tax=Pleurodeles waltl TaxID=8319 RepID=A0AAV7V9Q3_PLEWA|nr:hypothetical protein NDU88_002131 [Pleurodeles waltl]